MDPYLKLQFFDYVHHRNNSKEKLELLIFSAYSIVMGNAEVWDINWQREPVRQ